MLRDKLYYKKHIKSLANSTRLELAESGLHNYISQLMQDYPKGKVLDLGCGTGNIAKLLDKSGFVAYTADLEPTLYKWRKDRFKKVNLNKRVSFNSNAFDYVVCLDTFEHLTNPWQCMREISRVLKPNGLLILSTINLHNIKTRYEYFMNNRYLYFEEDAFFYPNHVHPFTYHELIMILHENNFSVKKILPYGKYSKSLYLILQEKLSSYFFYFRNILNRIRSLKEKKKTSIPKVLNDSKLIILIAKKTID